MSVTIRANARVLDLEIGQVVEGIEWTPLLEGAQARGYISVVAEDAAEPEAVPEQDPADPVETEVQPEPVAEPEEEAGE